MKNFSLIIWLGLFSIAIQAQIATSGSLTSAAFNNNLCTAITRIGSVKTVLEINTDTAVNCTAIVPATLTLKFTGGAMLTKTSGSVTFAGYGLENPLSDSSVFSGFFSGDITWSSATDYPRKFSANLWYSNANSATVKLSAATAALSGKQATIEVYPGTLSTAVTINAGHTIHFNRGTYPNTFVVGGESGQIIMNDNTSLIGDGKGQTFLQEPTDSPRLIYASGIVNAGHDGANTNLIVKGFTFTSNTSPYDSSASTIFLGNVVNAEVTQCHFKNTHGFAAYVGGFSTAGNSAKNVWITESIFEGLGTQNVGTVGGDNVHISKNTFLLSIPVGASFVSVVDIEPNALTYGTNNIIVSENVFDGRASASGWNAITVQKGYASAVRNVSVINNTIIGAENYFATYNASAVNTSTDTITSYGHGFIKGQALYITNAGSLPTGLSNQYVYAIPTGIDTLKVASSSANAFAGAAIDLTAAGSGYGRLNPIGNLSNGIQIAQVDMGVVSGNQVIGCSQHGLTMYLSDNIKISDNFFSGCKMLIASSSNSFIKNNILAASVKTELFSEFNILENEDDSILSVATVSGSNLVTVSIDQKLQNFYIGKTLTINGRNYMITSIDNKKLVVSPNAVTNFTGRATVHHSNNKYQNNSASGIALASGGLSVIQSMSTDNAVTDVTDANYTATSISGIIRYTSLTASRTVTLPSCANLNGKQFVIKDGAGTAGKHNIIIDGNASETIDGSATVSITTNHGSKKIQCVSGNAVTLN